MSETKVIFTRSDGETLTFGDGKLNITEIKGIGKIAPEIFTKKRAIGNGDIITGWRIPGREFSLKGDITDASQNAEYLHKLNAFFNPTYTFDAEVKHFGTSRKVAGCYLRSFDAGHGNEYVPIKPSITMFCEDAFFLSTEDYGEDIAGAHGGFHFPYHPTAQTPVIFGVFLYTSGCLLYNDGDVETYIKISMTMSGGVRNPAVIREGSRVTILGDFSAGDVIELDAYTKRITLNGQNISTRLGKDSRWSDMVLPLGLSTISVVAESGTNNISCRVFFDKRYLGVN